MLLDVLYVGTQITDGGFHGTTGLKWTLRKCLIQRFKESSRSLPHCSILTHRDNFATSHRFLTTYHSLPIIHLPKGI